VTVAPIDLTHLGLYTGGDAALERELLELFLGNATGYLALLAAAADDQAWRRAAHSLKGSALGVGAPKVAMLATAAEGLGRGDAGYAVLVELEDALSAVRSFAARRRKR
jgi:HPt (histidine-containing phosphotransfer) domain-containing protein